MKNIFQIVATLFLCSFLSSCQKYLGPNDSKYDADTQKFIDSSGISDLSQKFALDGFVKELKDSLLWEKFMAIYPMLGGTASTAKWNLKVPENSDAAYRLTFKGNPVYAGTGVLFPTGADYADTHFSDAMFSYNDNSISYYSRTQNSVNGYDMGCHDFIAPYNEMAIYNKGDASNWFGYYNFGPGPANTKGLFMLSATASNVTRYENGTSVKPMGVPVIGSTGLPILIGTVVHAPSVGKRECALAAIGKGLTGAQALTFYNIVQDFETALGR